MRVLLLACLLAEAVFASVLLNLDESEVCGVLKNATWLCKRQKSCPEGGEARESGWSPAVCSQKDGEEIVCCPPPGEVLQQTELQQLAWSGSWDRTPTGGWKLPVSSQRTSPGKETPASVSVRPPPPTTEPSVPGSASSTLPNTYSTEAAFAKADEMCAAYRSYMYEDLVVLRHSNVTRRKVLLCRVPATSLVVGSGGVDAAPFEFPHMAWIGYGEESDIHYQCGGSLISERYILSAAHCKIVDGRIARWANLGDTDLTTDKDVPKEEVVTVRIVESFIHPDFDAKKNWYNDIALFKLEKDLKFGRYVRPACLNTRRDRDEMWLTATGWGLIKPYSPFSPERAGGVGATVLQKLEMKVIPLSECNRTYSTLGSSDLAKLPDIIRPEGMMCAGGVAGRAICNGDSGGPLQLKVEPCMYDIFGVASFGLGCNARFPGVYTSVIHHVPWIVNIVWG